MRYPGFFLQLESAHVLTAPYIFLHPKTTERKGEKSFMKEESEYYLQFMDRFSDWKKSRIYMHSLVIQHENPTLPPTTKKPSYRLYEHILKQKTLQHLLSIYLLSIIIYESWDQGCGTMSYCHLIQSIILPHQLLIRVGIF